MTCTFALMPEIFPKPHKDLARLISAGFDGSTLSDSDAPIARDASNVIYKGTTFITISFGNDYIRNFGRFNKSHGHLKDFGLPVDDLVAIADFILQELTDLGYVTHRILNEAGERSSEQMTMSERIPLSRICENCGKSGGLKKFIFGPPGPLFDTERFVAGGTPGVGQSAHSFCELCKVGS